MVKLEDLDIRVVEGGILLDGDFLRGLSPEDVTIADGGVHLLKFPTNGVLAE